MNPEGAAAAMPTGRPKQAPAAALSRHVGVRFTDAERAGLDAAADAAGLSVSEYIRAAALKGPQARKKATTRRTMDPAEVSALNRLGVNLNQLTRAHNYGSDQPMRDALAETLADIRAILARHL